MKIGALTAPLVGAKSLADTCMYLAGLGVEAVEIGTGNYPPDGHCDPVKMLQGPEGVDAFIGAIQDSGLVLSALSCHGNPISPNVEMAAAHDAVFRATVRLAAVIRDATGWDVVVNGFSGLPAGAPGDKTPAWVTAPWPPEHLDALKYQWDEVAIPYWTEAHKLLVEYGMDFCIEPHPNMLVFNPDTLVRLRRACGKRICMNFDPSHFFWQSIDVVAAIRWLNLVAKEDGDAGVSAIVRHMHGKDCRVYPWNLDQKGVLDTTHYSEEEERTWIFRTVGYGHGEDLWRDLFSTLQMCGYRGMVSLEHEDSLMSPQEGFEKGIKFLQSVGISEEPGALTWA